MDNKQWNDIKNKYKKGQVIKGKVEYHASYGVFMDINEGDVKGLIPITNFLDEGIMSTDLYPKLGEEMDAVIIEFTEDHRQQIWLSVKPSSFELNS